MLTCKIITYIYSAMTISYCMYLYYNFSGSPTLLSPAQASGLPFSTFQFQFNSILRPTVLHSTMKRKGHLPHIHHYNYTDLHVFYQDVSWMHPSTIHALLCNPRPDNCYLNFFDVSVPSGLELMNVSRAVLLSLTFQSPFRLLVCKKRSSSISIHDFDARCSPPRSQTCWAATIYAFVLSKHTSPPEL